MSRALTIATLFLSMSPRLEALAPILGAPSQAEVRQGDTLVDIAYDHRLGFQALERLNPEVPVWIPEPGTRVHLPTEVILPSAPRKGLVINVPEMRLFDYTVSDGPRILSIAVGDAVDPTPTGEFRVGQKRVNPTWYVPESIRREKPELPATVPPGPDNPLGSRWMTIGQTSYGIHGTNNKWSIGHDATHGCVRLYESDMEELFERTREGTPLRFVYQTVKLGRRGDGIFVEAHPDLYGRDRDPVTSTLLQLFVFGLYDLVDREVVERTVREARGVPVRVGTIPATLLEPATSERPS
jgi:L,D-transpeptidase ErfK/SrfK